MKAQERISMPTEVSKGVVIGLGQGRALLSPILALLHRYCDLSVRRPMDLQMTSFIIPSQLCISLHNARLLSGSGDLMIQLVVVGYGSASRQHQVTYGHTLPVRAHDSTAQVLDVHDGGVRGDLHGVTDVASKAMDDAQLSLCTEV